VVRAVAAQTLFLDQISDTAPAGFAIRAIEGRHGGAIRSVSQGQHFGLAQCAHIPRPLFVPVSRQSARDRWKKHVTQDPIYTLFGGERLGPPTLVFVERVWRLRHPRSGKVLSCALYLHPHGIETRCGYQSERTY
jgi:hypothetical protein